MTIQGFFLLFELSMARMTTLPLWRMMSRSLCLPLGSTILSWSTRKSEPFKTTSELRSSATSTASGLEDLASVRGFAALAFFGLEAFSFAAFFSSFFADAAGFAVFFFFCIWDSHSVKRSQREYTHRSAGSRVRMSHFCIDWMRRGILNRA